MKLRFIAAALTFAVSTAMHAQSGMKGMDMKMDKKGAKGTVHNATGVVTKVDKDKVTIKHGPVPTMNWPSMTMAFTVKEEALMDKLGMDKKVDFEFRQEGGDYVVTAVK